MKAAYIVLLGFIRCFSKLSIFSLYGVLSVQRKINRVCLKSESYNFLISTSVIYLLLLLF